MTDTYIKPEIKPDPDALGASPAALDEEDIYEDAGDLEFNNDPNYQSLYLARVPKYVWEAWSKLDDDAEIQIGMIRMTNTIDPKTKTEKTQLAMLLSSDIAQHQMVPKEYDLDITDERVRNTFVFTEKDLPGFKSKSKEKFDPASANMPASLKQRLNSQKAPQQPRAPYDPNRPRQPYYKKAIPKRTTLQGKVRHEVNCVAVMNQESERLLAQRTFEAMQPKLGTKYFGKGQDLVDLGGSYVQPGSIAAQDKWGSFIKKGGAAQGGKKPQMQKTARMPQNELLDRIFECFREFNYWSMKAFRGRLQQPEVYLRETLDRIATLHKSGPFASHYSLKPENRLNNYGELGEAAAPDVGDGAEDSEFGGDDEDEDVKFEDAM
ncbi:putative Transcription initiation factor IIF subunit beta [Glarea lozoyensis 74030]|nr:putative Transcription initiation factor IIF subunit beta [Glarea lozoyensis 74030]